MNIIFLDIDGVLNSKKFLDDNNDEIMTSTVLIILSSSVKRTANGSKTDTTVTTETGINVSLIYMSIGKFHNFFIIISLTTSFSAYVNMKTI